jgi:hypothetical protein
MYSRIEDNDCRVRRGRDRSGRDAQHYVIKFVSDLRQVGGHFSPGHPVSSNNKTVRHDLTEILLKVALNTYTIKQTNKQKDNDCIMIVNKSFTTIDI